MPRWIKASVSVSTELVASSMMKISGRASTGDWQPAPLPARLPWLRTVLDAYVEHWPRCNRNMGLDRDNNPQLIWNLSLDTLPDTFVDYPGHVDLLGTDADSEPEATPATPVETSGCT